MTHALALSKHKPVLDESSFQQLLAAAYVLQQNNDSLQHQDSQLNSSKTLSDIAEIQAHIKASGLNAPAAAKLITERLLKIIGASGVSFSLITDGYLDCVAESGVPARVPGSCISPHSLVATERLKSGGIFASELAQNDMRLDSELCREVGAASIVAAPISRFGQIAGVLEARWDRENAFREADLKACRMMAGLATSMLERNARSDEQAPAIVEPSLEMPSFRVPSPKNGNGSSDLAKGMHFEDDSASSDGKDDKADSVESRCRVCGRPFGGGEVFCGNCSMPRLAAAPAEGLQSKWASLWYMQQAQGTLRDRQVDEVHHGYAWRRVSSEQPKPKDVNQAPRTEHTAKTQSASLSKPMPAKEQPVNSAPGTRSASNGSITSRAHGDHLPMPVISSSPRVRVHRTRTVLAMVVVVFAVGLFVTAVWPSSTASGLNWFESVLVELGLAQVPAHAPAPNGNPDVRVWVDVHTALYYCPGADLYGKTPDGEFATQLSAQQRHIEPASRTACN